MHIPSLIIIYVHVGRCWIRKIAFVLKICDLRIRIEKSTKKGKVTTPWQTNAVMRTSSFLAWNNIHWWLQLPNQIILTVFFFLYNEEVEKTKEVFLSHSFTHEMNKQTNLIKKNSKMFIHQLLSGYSNFKKKLSVSPYIIL